MIEIQWVVVPLSFHKYARFRRSLKAYTLEYLNDNSKSIPIGYYDDLEDGLSLAYEMGIASSTTPEVKSIKYLVDHKHDDNCYPLASCSTVSQTVSSRNTVRADENEGDNLHCFTCVVKCNICNGSVSGVVYDSGNYYNIYNRCTSAAQSKAVQSFKLNHLVNGRCRSKGYQCGKDEGECEVTDIGTLSSGDTIISATIEF